MSEWQAYARLEPFGEERADLRSAIIACVIANANRERGQKAHEVGEFMPKFDRTEEEQGDPLAFARMMTLAFGGTVAEGV